jgi:hypothetical protein
MSTSEQAREEEPRDPVRIIFDFKDANQQMIDSAVNACSNPSHESLAIFSSHVEQASAKIRVFFVEKFFKSTDSPLIIGKAVGSARTALLDILASTKELKLPQGSLEFDEETVEVITNQVIDNDEDYAAAKAQEVCEAYDGCARNFEHNVLNSSQVISFIENDIRLANRKNSAKFYSGVAAAAFAGTLLANRISKRR